MAEAKRPGSRGKMTVVNLRGETIRGESTGGWFEEGRNVLLPDIFSLQTC